MSDEDLVDKHNRRPQALCIMGPTASGKTDLAIALAERLGGEIISVDSALVYKGMDIGTAKPSVEELQRAPHRLISFLDPSQSYSVADFCRDAKREIEAIVANGKVPILVGGTMMYFKALLQGISAMPPSQEDVRAGIEKEAASQGWPAMHAQLADLDPITAGQLHPNHSQRICRALEVYRISGQPISSYRTGGEGGLLEQYDWCQFALAPTDRKCLHERIAKRFRQMLEKGFVAEVKSLKDRGDLHEDLPAIRAVGYRQVWQFLNGELDEQSMYDKGVAATRQLAKRQLTWLRSWQGLNWIYTQDNDGRELTKGEIVNNALNFLAKRAI